MFWKWFVFVGGNLDLWNSVLKVWLKFVLILNLGLFMFDCKLSKKRMFVIVSIY